MLLVISKEYKPPQEACKYLGGNHSGKQQLETTAADLSKLHSLRIPAERGMQTTLGGNGKASVVILSIVVSLSVVDFVRLTILFALVFPTPLISYYRYLSGDQYCPDLVLGYGDRAHDQSDGG